VHESEKVASLLIASDFIRTEDEKTANIIIFNTCTVRNTAESKIISHMAILHKEKLQGRSLILALVGCLSQRDGVAKDLAKKFPKLDIILGTHNIALTVDSIKKVQENGKRVIEITDKRAEVPEFDSLVPSADKQKPNTHYINITYGCNNYCTYCIVPYVRGREQSRPKSEIEKEFKKVVTKIIQEITDKNNIENINNKAKNAQPTHIIYLLGQNVNSYLCPETNINFVSLLNGLCDGMASITREKINIENMDNKHAENKILVNFMSSHPKDFSDDLANLIATRPQIEQNIHLPMQSGCDRILKLMNRGYTIDKYRKIIKNLRNLVPNVRITTDIICGFPGETEEDFVETVAIMKEFKFNSAFIFPYSRRSGTVADKMDGQLDTKTKKKRTTELLNIQKQIQTNL